MNAAVLDENLWKWFDTHIFINSCFIVRASYHILSRERESKRENTRLREVLQWYHFALIAMEVKYAIARISFSRRSGNNILIQAKTDFFWFSWSFLCFIFTTSVYNMFATNCSICLVKNHSYICRYPQNETALHNTFTVQSMRLFGCFYP